MVRFNHAHDVAVGSEVRSCCKISMMLAELCRINHTHVCVAQEALLILRHDTRENAILIPVGALLGQSVHFWHIHSVTVGKGVLEDLDLISGQGTGTILVDHSEFGLGCLVVDRFGNLDLVALGTFEA